jgi:glycosyltransferase involved in cell wall biosynthesis
MIVKNESRVIERLLASVVSLIDTYVICDTGSTDNTPEIIEQFFASRGIAGHITHEPFRDFGYNRTVALQQCLRLFPPPQADYILLLDADMVFQLRVSPEEFRRWLVQENAVMVRLFQGNPYFSTENARIVRNVPGISYKGVTHEYLDIPAGSGSTTRMPKTVADILDLGDGGAKSDKFERDIRLLKQGLIVEPEMRGRYLFYLGNSLKDAGKNEEAIEIYRQNIKEGGWVEEVWHSWFNMGQCYKHLHKHDQAVACWLEAYDVFPNRLENLYEICRIYREGGKHRLAFVFYDLAKRVQRTHPEPEFLFTQLDIYRYRLDYEMSVFGYYWNPLKEPLGKICMDLMSMTEVYYDRPIYANILSNYKFYCQKLQDLPGVGPVDWNAAAVVQAELSDNAEGEFVSSTPSLVWHQGRMWVNVRWVNYRIDGAGQYINRDRIHTRNVLHCISAASLIPGRVAINEEVELETEPAWNGRYVGAEDVRLFSDARDIELKYVANRGLEPEVGPVGAKMCVEYGTIATDTGKTRAMLLKVGGQPPQEIEKNWVLASNGMITQMIYGWGPLVVGTVDEHGDFNEISRQTNIPAFFRDLRGSTNGVLIGGEIWFICHMVSYEERRFYYHLFVVLDSATWKYKRHSPLFTFTGEKVEYTLGMVYRPNLLALDIGFSVMDRTTQFMQVPLSAIPWIVEKN